MTKKLDIYCLEILSFLPIFLSNQFVLPVKYPPNLSEFLFRQVKRLFCCSIQIQNGYYQSEIICNNTVIYNCYNQSSNFALIIFVLSFFCCYFVAQTKFSNKSNKNE